MATSKIKKGDTVRVIAGVDKGKEGKVLAVKDGKVFCLKNGYEIQESYDKVIVIKDLGTILTFIDDASSSDFEPYDHERVFKAFNEIYSIIIKNSSL